MATKTLASACNTSTNLSHTLGTTKNCTDFHDASFSSYISNAKSNSILKLVESKQDLSTAVTNLQAYKIGSQRKMGDDEISIFGAEKYFNEEMEEENSRVTEKGGGKHQPMKDNKVGLQSMDLQSQSGIRNTYSEASWNSRSELLTVLSRDQTPSQKNKVNGKSFFSPFSWNCSCSDSKSVDVDETVGENKNSRNGKKTVNHAKESMDAPVHVKMDSIYLNGLVQKSTKETIPCQNFDTVILESHKDDSFAFTVSKSMEANRTADKICEETLEEENVRKSLEVFGSPILHKVEKTLSTDRKLTTFVWDVNPKTEDFPATYGSMGIQDDEESDSSSDLFEIQNLSENVHPFFRRQVSDGMSSNVTTTCYEPSEASIDWSVVTASAVNFSTMSNYKERAPEALIPRHKSTAKISTKTTPAKTAVGKEVQRSHPNGFLGCKSQRAAKVAGEAYKVPGKAESNAQRRHRTDTLKTMTEFQTETDIRDFKPASARHAASTCSAPRWHSAQASQSLYTLMHILS